MTKRKDSGLAPVSKGSRILVTGSSGFIGRHLTALLVRVGYRVAGLDGHSTGASDVVTDYLCDLRDDAELRRVLRDAAPEAVVHLAARTDLEGVTLADYASNIEGVENLAAAIREARTVRRAVCTSTQLVCHVGYAPAHDADYRPTTLYGESKVRTEQIWRARDGGGTIWCVVRPTTIWGPLMKPHYQRFFRMIRDGRYVHVSGGPYSKSYGYVGNTVVQYQRLIEAPADRVRCRTFYLADYESLVLEEWAELFRAGLGAPRIRTVPRVVAASGAHVGDLLVRLGWRSFPFTTFRLTNVVTSYVMDLTATREVCGDLPYSLAEGVSETVAWLRSVWDGQTDAGGASATTRSGDAI